MAGNTFKSVKVYELVMNLDGTIKEVGRELSQMNIPLIKWQCDD